MSHVWVSDDCGVACLVCGVHVDEPDTVLVTMTGGRLTWEITAADLAEQVECQLNDGDGHYLTLAPQSVECACGVRIDMDTEGVPTACTRVLEDAP